MRKFVTWFYTFCVCLERSPVREYEMVDPKQEKPKEEKNRKNQDSDDVDDLSRRTAAIRVGEPIGSHSVRPPIAPDVIW